MGKTKTVGKRLFYIAIAAAVILIAMVIPSPEGLSDAGKLSLALIIAGVVLWVTEPMDMAISALLLMILMPVFGILPVMGVWTNFISSVIFFVLASFGFTAALLKTKVPSKIVFALMRLTKGNSKAIVLAFMVATALVSAFIIRSAVYSAFCSGSPSAIFWKLLKQSPEDPSSDALLSSALFSRRLSAVGLHLLAVR